MVDYFDGLANLRKRVKFFFKLALAAAGAASISTVSASVSIAQFSALSKADRIVISWDTGQELDNAGFHVWRGEMNELSQALQITEAVIPPNNPGQTLGSHYEYEDDAIEENVSYFYWLQDIDTWGNVTFHGSVSASVIGGEEMPATDTPTAATPSPAPTATPQPTVTLLPTNTPLPQTSDSSTSFFSPSQTPTLTPVVSPVGTVSGTPSLIEATASAPADSLTPAATASPLPTPIPAAQLPTLPAPQPTFTATPTQIFVLPTLQPTPSKIGGQPSPIPMDAGIPVSPTNSPLPPLSPTDGAASQPPAHIVGEVAALTDSAMLPALGDLPQINEQPNSGTEENTQPSFQPDAKLAALAFGAGVGAILLGLTTLFTLLARQNRKK